MIPDEYREELRHALNARVESVCAHLLNGGKKIGKRWSCGGVDGGPGKSMDVELAGEKIGVFHDRATGEAGDLIKLWMLNRGLTYPQAVAEAADFCKMAKPEKEDRRIDPSDFKFEEPAAPRSADDGPPAYKIVSHSASIDWARCVSEFTPEKASELCEWRGYSLEFVTWLRDNDLVGLFRGSFAFPVHGHDGRVTAIHYRGPERGWFYHPKGAETAPLIVGSPAHASFTLAFESQWDALSVLDKLGAHLPENAGIYAAFITRSATANTDTSVLNAQSLIACPQNDPREKANKTTGRTPSEEWLHRIQSSRSKTTALSVFETPNSHKDCNDWIRAENPNHFDVFKMVVEGARNPALDGVKTTEAIRNTDTSDDQNALIGHKRRFLCKGGSWMFVGPSGVGKSTLISGLTLHAAAGVPWHGITFRRPLKTLVVQAENDDGDLKEMIDGAISAVGFDKGTADRAGRNIQWKRETSRTGLEFCEWLEVLIRETAADLVVIDPLLSFIGDDISQQKVASQFFRNWLQPVLDRTGAICVLVHHTGKTPTDSKSRQNWSESDFAYLGIGSSELTNWPRAVSVLVPDGVDTGRFKFLIAKRGKRAGMIDQFNGEKTTSIRLMHAVHGLGWSQCALPDASECAPRNGGRRQSLTADDILKAIGPGTHATRRDVLTAELMLKHGVSNRTVKDRVDALLLAAKIHVAERTPREGGGHEIEWLRVGTSSIGNNQPETSN